MGTMIRPDEGMGALLARLQQHARSGAAIPEQAPAPPGPDLGGGGLELEAGAGAGIVLRLGNVLDALATELERQRSRDLGSWRVIHPIQIPPGQSAAAGILEDPDRWGPRAGWAWLVTRLTGTLATGGVSMTIYRDAAIPTNTLLGPVGGGTWEPKSCILLPGQQLVWQSVGAGIAVDGEGIEIALDWLPRFLL